MIRKLAPGNNHFKWTPERLNTLELLLGLGKTPTQIAGAFSCHDIQCIFYGMRKLAKQEARAAA